MDSEVYSYPIWTAQRETAIRMDVREYGAIPDDDADDRPAFTGALTGLAARIENNPGERGTLYVPPGTYDISVEGTGVGLDLPSHVTLLLAESAVLRVIATARSGYDLIRVRQRQDVILSGGTLLGDRDLHLGTSGEYGMGVAIRGSRTVLVEKMIARDFWGDGFYIGGGTGTIDQCWDITLIDCKAERNRRTGLGVVAGEAIWVLRCSFNDTRGVPLEAGIDLEPNAGQTVAHVTIERCEVRRNDRGILVSVGGYYRWGRNHHNTIRNNIVESHVQCGIQLSDCQYISVERNVVQGSDWRGILLFGGCRNNRIAWNDMGGNNDAHVLFRDGAIGLEIGVTPPPEYIVLSSPTSTQAGSMIGPTRMNVVARNFCRPVQDRAEPRYGVFVGRWEWSVQTLVDNKLFYNRMDCSPVPYFNQGKNTILIGNR